MRTNQPGGIRVVAVDADDTRLGEARLGHGEHPEVVLGALGWGLADPTSAAVNADGALELAFRVGPLDGIRPRAAAPRATPT